MDIDTNAWTLKYLIQLILNTIKKYISYFAAELKRDK